MKNDIIHILMKRDDMTEQEAIETLNYVREMVRENPANAEDIMLEELGLELDYILDII